MPTAEVMSYEAIVELSSPTYVLTPGIHRHEVGYHGNGITWRHVGTTFMLNSGLGNSHDGNRSRERRKGGAELPLERRVPRPVLWRQVVRRGSPIGTMAHPPDDHMRTA
jgi:hypothetical protein